MMASATQNLLACALWVLFSGSVSAAFRATAEAAEPQPIAPSVPASVQRVDFGRDVRPILAKACYHCHGPDQDEGGLNFTDAKTPFAQLDSGETPIVPGQPDSSELLRRITSVDEHERMPPESKPLSREQIQVIRNWIEQGAVWESHWAFQPVKRPEIPSVKNTAWVRSPIDAFVLHKLEDKSLTPNEPASQAALIRRVYYDLIGLPPSPQEVQAFVESQDPQAYPQLIEKLLAHPGYGEKWGRHWLDVVRYAETNSFERDAPKPNAWRYRDYVIRSFNDDKPYDQFIREQLAGDELERVTHESIIATGFYRLGVWDDEPADKKQAYYDEMDDLVATTSQAFLGLTVGCARCHDHKIDPIPQTDYYQMVAFLRDVRPYGTREDQRSNNQTDISPPEISALHQLKDRQLHDVRQQMRQLEQAAILKMPGEVQRQTEGPERRKALKEHLQSHLNENEWIAYQALKSWEHALEEQNLPDRQAALSVALCNPHPPTTNVLARGNPHVEGAAVEPGFPDLFQTTDPILPDVAKDAKSAGRRRILAEWIASPENLLTSRVIANRVWQHHFGRGIVRSSNNFGLLGSAPTHPELLDWLASELVDQGWRLKPLHRQILLSNAYQMSSAANPMAEGMDPQNDLFWRFDMRRLTAEEIRDSMLAIAGTLNTNMYGPSIYPIISEEVLAGQSKPGEGWGESTDEERNRRSIYIHVKRSLITPLLAAFDYPEPDSTCEARFSTTQPTQALGMLNSEELQRLASQFATRLQRDRPDDLQAQVRLGLELVSSRRARADDIQMGLALIDKLKAEGATEQQARQLFCLAALNLNEFMFLE